MYLVFGSEFIFATDAPHTPEERSYMQVYPPRDQEDSKPTFEVYPPRDGGAAGGPPPAEGGPGVDGGYERGRGSYYR